MGAKINTKKVKKFTFHGGLHPTDGYDKELSQKEPLFEYLPSQVEISMEQSGGGICKFIAQKGDWVKKGELLGEPVTFTAARLHSSVTGIVQEIKSIKTTANKIVEACIIDTNANNQKNNSINKQAYELEIMDILQLSRAQVITCIKNSGIVGLGGAGFPSYIKYETQKKINTLIINAVECEPFLTCDECLMLEEPFAILNGVQLLLKASLAERAMICVEDNKKEAIEILKNVISTGLNTIELIVLETKYPQGGERQLIQTILGKEVPAGGLPADIGVIVSNVATVKSCADAVLGNKVLTDRIVTVTGEVKTPRNYKVPIGTRLNELIELSGGVTCNNNRVILGGPMTGTCIAEHYVKGMELTAVTKTTSGVIVLKKEDYVESPCIRCGACGQTCPAGLTPFKIEFAFLKNQLELCEQLYASECIGCGCCSYVCPARRELATRNKLARDAVKKRKRERETKG